jgi:hypothetical protein
MSGAGIGKSVPTKAKKKLSRSLKVCFSIENKVVDFVVSFLSYFLR